VAQPARLLGVAKSKNSAFSEPCYSTLNSRKTPPNLNLIDAEILFCHPERSRSAKKIAAESRTNLKKIYRNCFPKNEKI
jgi:hypothetical protein